MKILKSAKIKLDQDFDLFSLAKTIQKERMLRKTLLHYKQESVFCNSLIEGIDEDIVKDKHETELLESEFIKQCNNNNGMITNWINIITKMKEKDSEDDDIILMQKYITNVLDEIRALKMYNEEVIDDIGHIIQLKLLLQNIFAKNTINFQDQRILENLTGNLEAINLYSKKKTNILKKIEIYNNKIKRRRNKLVDLNAEKEHIDKGKFALNDSISELPELEDEVEDNQNNINKIMVIEENKDEVIITENNKEDNEYFDKDIELEADMNLEDE
jgi:hypothetical protein